MPPSRSADLSADSPATGRLVDRDDLLSCFRFLRSAGGLPAAPLLARVRERSHRARPSPGGPGSRLPVRLPNAFFVTELPGDVLQIEDSCLRLQNTRHERRSTFPVRKCDIELLASCLG